MGNNEFFLEQPKYDYILNSFENNSSRRLSEKEFKSTCEPIELASNTNTPHVCRESTSIELSYISIKHNCLNLFNGSVILIINKTCGDHIRAINNVFLVKKIIQKAWKGNSDFERFMYIS